MTTLTPPNVLMVYPTFSNTSFWNYTETCKLVGAKYPAPPLGLVTVAAMLPGDWPVRLVDCNTEPLTDEALDWADLVMFGGMITQQTSLLELAARAKSRGKATAVGGPDATSSPEVYADLDFRILGEAEGAIDRFIAAWEAGEREGEFKAPLHTIDVTQTPIPRFDLLRFSDYVQVNVQFSRGCPFLCEFCDIIELFGRKPRTKDTDQMLAELDAIYAAGYRGHLDFVDDNLIGNKKAVKAFLPHLIDWQKRHGYPFEFSTEASLNLADDEEFLGMMRDAGFFACFIGIESPDPDVLVAMQKKQNTKRDIAACVHKINSYGVFVVAGFIVGFDNESTRVSEGMIELIEEASIPVAMVGLLTALPNTQLQRRLEKEGRLHALYATPEREVEGDQCVSGLNFETLTPRDEILSQFHKIIDAIYAPDAFFARVKKTVELLDCSGTSGDLRASTILHDVKNLATFMWGVTVKRPDMRSRTWGLVWHVLRKNPRAIKHALYTAGLYAHLGPFSEFVKTEITSRIEDVRADPEHPNHRTFRGELVAAE